VLCTAFTGVWTIRVNNEYATSAAAKTVVSPGLSYIGATSTVDALARPSLFPREPAVIPTSAPITSTPSRPSRIESSSRVVHPPTSEVPVAGEMRMLAWVLSTAQYRERASRASEEILRSVLYYIHSTSVRRKFASQTTCLMKRLPGANAGSRTSMSTEI
jgi:hypothetical protein